MTKEDVAYIVYEVMKQRKMTRKQAEEFILDVFRRQAEREKITDKGE